MKREIKKRFYRRKYGNGRMVASEGFNHMETFFVDFYLMGINAVQRASPSSTWDQSVSSLQDTL